MRLPAHRRQKSACGAAQKLGVKKTPAYDAALCAPTLRAAKPGCRIGGNGRIVYLGAGGVKGSDLFPTRTVYILLNGERLLLPTTDSS